MSFTDGKPRVATADEVALPWCGHKDGRCFRCNLCGEFIRIGETWRFVFTGNGVRMTNFLAHVACCGDDPITKARALAEEGYQRFWWMLDPSWHGLPPHPEKG